MLRSPDVDGWSGIVAWFDCDDVDGWFDVVLCNGDDDRADVDGWSSIFLCSDKNIGGDERDEQILLKIQMQLLHKFNISEAPITCT